MALSARRRFSPAVFLRVSIVVLWTSRVLLEVAAHVGGMPWDGGITKSASVCLCIGMHVRMMAFVGVRIYHRVRIQQRCVRTLVQIAAIGFNVAVGVALCRSRLAGTSLWIGRLFAVACGTAAFVGSIAYRAGCHITTLS
jgi:hypothetical protein